MYQHFNTTESSKVVAQWTVCEPTSVPKKFGVALVHEKSFRDLSSGLV